jgi:hypothetical protein
MPAAVAVALAACSTSPPTAPGWVRVGDTVGYGIANSEFDLMLGCASGNIIFTTIGDDAFSGTRPARITVDSVRFNGTETSDPPDGVPTTRIAVPVDHPAMRQLERPAKYIAFTPGGTIPAGPLPAQFVRACRTNHR